ncbi:GFA family protein [Pelagovum pacificum]|uniref:GFA family protein n=2 Tax=Pelagovum pacificum TaxID=2588711 RepID=A0A5C5GKQ3_9RHOB|nr:GFA family protein [Pelagovum pacificum]
MTKLPLTGGCQCGAIRFACDAMPFNIHACHCRMCQKAVGGPFAVICPTEKAAFRVTKGEIAWFASSDVARRGFCRDCGTPMIFDYPHAGDIGVLAGCFDQPEGLPPERNCGTESRLGWVATLHDLPASETYANSDPEGLLERIRSSNHQHPDS